MAIGAVVRRRARRDGHQRPRHLPQVGGHRPGRDDRIAAGHHRRAARRPQHRPADQDRAGRPAAGDVRPQRRMSRRHRGAVLAGRLLHDGLRGGAPGRRLHDAGVPAVRRLPGQRRRAVADSRPGDAAQDRRSSTRPAPNGNGSNGDVAVHALQARRAAGAAVGGARHAGLGAPHRRPGEGGRHRQRQLRPGQPRAHGAHAARRRSPTSPTTFRCWK